MKQAIWVREADTVKDTDNPQKKQEERSGLSAWTDQPLRGEGPQKEVIRPELPLVMKGSLTEWQALDGERWPDPEVAWKNRAKEMLDQGRGRGSSRPPENQLRAGVTSGAWSTPSENRSGPISYPMAYGVGEDAGDGSGGGPSRGRRFGRMLIKQTAAAAMVFALMWGIHHSQSPLALQGRALVAEALTKDLAFDQMSAWYQKTFSGAPSLLPAFGSHKQNQATKVTAPLTRFLLPVKGKVTTPYSSRLQGIVLATEPHAKISAMDEGRIEFAGFREDTGYTVVIRHTGGFRTTYGYLTAGAWEIGDWLKAGDVVGTTEEAQLFLAMMKDQRYFDPERAVSFD